jgi:hypothetical protein
MAEGLGAEVRGRFEPMRMPDGPCVRSSAECHFKTASVRGRTLCDRLAKVALMLRALGRLFVIRLRFEALVIIFALALAAAERGRGYLLEYPGWGGQLLFLACLGSVALAAAKIFDCLRHEGRQVRDGNGDCS